MRELRVGDKAPHFSLRDSTGKSVTLKDFYGKKNVLLIFYPGDDTPGCTKQLCAVRDDTQKFHKLNAVAFGINHADAESHNRFIKKYGLKTTLLIDEGKRVSVQYGAVKKFFGHPVIKRSVFVIDKKGVISYVKRGLPPNKEILEVLRQLERNK